VAYAERVAYEAGLRRVAVISGVGVRRYYERLGYWLEGAGRYMVKDLVGGSVTGGGGGGGGSMLETCDTAVQARSRYFCTSKQVLFVPVSKQH
jgi:hypothetical protein